MEGQQEDEVFELPRKIKETLPEFRNVCEALTCTICYEPFHNAVLSACGHSYCSVCIRKYITYRPSCPQCGADAFDGQLRVNKSTSEAAAQLKPLVSRLNRLLAQLDSGEGLPVSSLPPPDREKGVAAPKLHQDGAQKAPTTDKPLHVKSKFEPSQSDKKSEAVDRHDEQLEVEACPKCGINVSIKKMALHLATTCSEKTTITKTTFKPRKHLPKLVYSLMKESDLKKKCKEVGLNFKGDRKTLINRHQKFTILYNSECDLPNPRSMSEVCRQVEREESLEKASRDRPQLTLLQFDRNTDSKVIEKKQKQYLEENKSAFKQLILKVKGNNDVVMNPATLTALQDNKENSGDEFAPDGDSAILQEYRLTASSAESVGEADPSLERKRSRSPQINLPDEGPIAKRGRVESVESLPDACHSKNLPERSSISSSIMFLTNSRDGSSSSQGGLDSTLNRRNSTDSQWAGKKTTCGKPTSNTPSRQFSSKAVDKPLSIRDSLARSAERVKSVNKVECPVCGSSIVERYLNIHLDKCLRDSEPAPSPILSRRKDNAGKAASSRKRKMKMKMINLSTDEDEDDDIFISQYSSQDDREIQVPETNSQSQQRSTQSPVSWAQSPNLLDSDMDIFEPEIDLKVQSQSPSKISPYRSANERTRSRSSSPVSPAVQLAQRRDEDRQQEPSSSAGGDLDLSLMHHIDMMTDKVLGGMEPRPGGSNQSPAWISDSDLDDEDLDDHWLMECHNRNKEQGEASELPPKSTIVVERVSSQTNKVKSTKNENVQNIEPLDSVVNPDDVDTDHSKKENKGKSDSRKGKIKRGRAVLDESCQPSGSNKGKGTVKAEKGSKSRQPSDSEVLSSATETKRKTSTKTEGDKKFNPPREGEPSPKKERMSRLRRRR